MKSPGDGEAFGLFFLIFRKANEMRNFDGVVFLRERSSFFNQTNQTVYVSRGAQLYGRAGVALFPGGLLQFDNEAVNYLGTFFVWIPREREPLKCEAWQGCRC